MFLKETLPPELRVPFRMDTFNTIRQSGILWSGPTGEHGSLQTTPRRAAFHTEAPCAGISDRRFFRRLAFTVFVQGIGMDGCFLVIGFYIKQQFAISKNMNTLMQITQGETRPRANDSSRRAASLIALACVVAQGSPRSS